MPPETYLFLSLAGTAQSDLVRMLDTAGRWAVHGSAQVPLLAWPAAQTAAADAAARRVSGARACEVRVITHDAPGDAVQIFGDAFEAALDAPAAQSSARARRLRTEADKLEAFCVLVRAASAAADQAAFAEVARAATSAMRVRFGGGSITSAFAWLAGPAGKEALRSLLAGEVELAGKLSLREISEAARLAQEAQRLHDPG